MPIAIDKLVRSSRKTIALIIQPDGTLMVRAPLRMSDVRIRAFVEDHAEWVTKTRAKVRSAVRAEEKRYAEGELFPFMGQSYPLKIVPRQRPYLKFDYRAFTISKTALPKAKEVFIKWYENAAALNLLFRTSQLATSYHYGFKRIRISSARTRWGSCSTSGTISFTYRLIMAPPEVVDYVIIHELVHTKIHNHSKTFWRRVEQIMPDYKARQSWLKKNGGSLA